jgi:hypothetical protein
MDHLLQLFRNLKPAELIARIGIFGTFLGHGIVALEINPKWIPLIKAFGFSNEQAITIMPYIGMLDIVVAFLALLIPLRIVLIWAFTWAFLTALSRPISGLPLVEFIERASNWTFPLALLVMQGFPKKTKDIFSVRTKSAISG